MRKQRKVNKRLTARIEDHAKLDPNKAEAKVSTRMETGGYHRPGSRKK